MTSIDDLFRKPRAATKRKLEDPSASFLQHHEQQNKAPKLSNGSTPRRGREVSENNSARYASVEDESDRIEEDDDDLEAGPALPPGDDDEVADEDDEGRFFGGGVSKQEKQVLDFIDQNEAEDVDEKIDISWLKRTALNFERKISKNAELRAKYESDPMKFVGSEADLDSEIKGLSLLSEHTELYKDFVRSGCVSSLIGLLAHENTDIAISVCELLAELTDEDAGAEEQQWETLVAAMIDADLVELLVSNLGRLDENSESDRAGVYHVLNVIENLLSMQKYVERFGKSTKLLKWLMSRIQNPDVEARAKVGQNRQYAAEILAIVLQNSESACTGVVKIDGVDSLLQLLSAYRKRDPEKDSDEEEFAENLFDCVVSLVKVEDGANEFLDKEGLELCLIMVREGKLSKARALRILDHALSGHQGSMIGEKLVEAAGLKTIFSLFMKTKKPDRETLEHMIGIFASLLRYLPAESAARIRTLAKFVEKEYEKCKKLIELRKDYEGRIDAVNARIQQERNGLSDEDIEDRESEWLSRRFDAGFFTLQTLDIILSWLTAEDDGARKVVDDVLKSQKSSGLVILKRSLEEQLSSVDLEEGKDMAEMLQALLYCLA